LRNERELDLQGVFDPEDEGLNTLTSCPPIISPSATVAEGAATRAEGAGPAPSEGRGDIGGTGSMFDAKVDSAFARRAEGTWVDGVSLFSPLIFLRDMEGKGRLVR
jgi:hypothetical protein